MNKTLSPPILADHILKFIQYLSLVLCLIILSIHWLPEGYFSNKSLIDNRPLLTLSGWTMLGIFALSTILRGIVIIRYLSAPPAREALEESSRFLTWAVPLPHFHFHHEPYRRESSHSNFFGREELCDKFLSVLKNSQNSSGSYLVAGYRGVGKTSFVKKVLEDYRMGRADFSRVIHPSALTGIPHYLNSRLTDLQAIAHLYTLKLQNRLNNYSHAKRSAPSPLVYTAVNAIHILKNPIAVPTIIVLMALFFTSPSTPPMEWFPVIFGEKEDHVLSAYTFLVTIIIISALIYLYLSRGIEALTPSKWWAWLFRPVLLIQINLGHEKLDTKRLLFDIATLLHIRYREHLGIFSLSTPSKLLIAAAATLWFSSIIYSQTTPENEHAEQTIERLIFGVYSLNESQIPEDLKHIKCDDNQQFSSIRWPDSLKRTFFDRERFKIALRAQFRLCRQTDPTDTINNYVDALTEIASQTASRPGFRSAKYCVSILSGSGNAEGATLAQRTYCEIAESLSDLTRWIWLGTPSKVFERETCERALEPRPQRAKPPFVLWYEDRQLKGIEPPLDPINDDPEKNDQATKKTVIDPGSLCNSLATKTNTKPYTESRPPIYDEKETIAATSPLNKYYENKNTDNTDEFQILPNFATCENINTSDAHNVICTKQLTDTTPFYENNWLRFITTHFLTDVANFIPGQYPRPYHLLVFVTTYIIFITIIHILFLMGPGKVARQLAYIHSRIVASETIETGIESKTTIGMGLARRRRTYQPLDSRQAESLILDALETNRRILRLLPKPDIIFIFDELDKINPTRELIETTDSHAMEISPAVAVRRRKYEVEQLLSNLKNMITVAPCRFIFIAGRDMMDADLADQGEVNHLYSSLFDETFYVPSFLTDASDDEAEDISSMVEQYVCRRLMPRAIAIKLSNDIQIRNKKKPITDNVDYSYWTLKTYSEYLRRTLPKGNKDEWRIAELISFIQDFIYYLSYRSAGSPKKLALQFEQFVQPVPRDLFHDTGQQYHPHFPLTHSIRFVLRFDHREQYQVQLISHVFIMLHGETSHLVRQFGDKLSLSTFSILDYLFKFHAVAFSIRDLERMPDVLDIHRAPALPQVIDILLGKMLTPYLRRVENGLFDYRFLHYFQPEVAYISQFSERDLAAFNFTLDESISIKQHYRDLLEAQLRYEARSRGNSTLAYPPTSLSLASLHTILGDLYTLDREFSEALTEYRNALSHLSGSISHLDLPNFLQGGSAETTAIESNDIDSTDERKYYPITSSVNALISYVRILLKMGLMSEQRSQYDNAIARYFHAYRAVDHVMRRKIGKRAIAPNISLLTVLVQPYICLAFVHAKKDPTPNQSDRIIQRMIEKFEKYLLESPKKDDRFQDIAPVGRDIALFKSRLVSRWAEVRVVRSRFWGAASKHIEALDLLISAANETDYAQPNSRADSLRAIGFNLSGLADALLAIVCYRYNLRAITDRDFDAKIPSPPGRTAWYKGINDRSNPSERLISRIKKALFSLDEIRSDENLKKIFENEEPDHHLVNPGPKMKQLLQTAEELGPDLYVQSAIAYFLAEAPSEAALSLLKLQYFLSFAFSQRTLIDFTFKAPSQLIPRKQWKWIFPESFDKPSPTEELMTRSFEASYDVHRTRLHNLYQPYSSNDTNTHKHPSSQNSYCSLLGWIAPPISQFSRVLRAYWIAKPLENRTISDWEKKVDLLDIRAMGAFPIHERIFASYLKGGLLHEQAERLIVATREEHSPHHPPTVDEIGDLLCRSLFYLINAAEDGSAYDVGTSLLSPQLGLIYYRMWRVLFVGRRFLKHIKHKITQTVSKHFPFDEIQSELQGERSRFLLERYCQDKALKLLGDMTGRHTGEHGLSEFVNRRYYLHDSFSDPYIQGLWAVDYGLVPLVRRLKVHLRDLNLELSEKIVIRENDINAPVYNPTEEA